MNRKSAIAAVAGAASILVLAIAGGVFVTGCGFGTGPTQTVDIDEPLGAAAVTDVNISMGAGKLNIQPGASGLVSGVITYNVEPWKPVITRTDSSLAIKQGTTKGISGVSTDVINDWRLTLGSAPMRLAITAGAYQGTYELGGLSLQRLSIKDGASKTRVSFASPNPTQMESLVYETGASSVTLTGLADANFKKLQFKGGAGSFTLDFSGQLRTSASATVDTGVSTVHISVPSGTAARVVLKGKLTEVNPEGNWTRNDKSYATAAAVTGNGKLLTITVSMDLGSLTLTAD